MDRDVLFAKAAEILEGEPRLIRLPTRGRAVFVGDTHGDLSATEKVIEKYLMKSTRIVFLGDYVDRGDQSEQNILFLLQTKIEHPEKIILLAGNHEGFMTRKFLPAHFWETLATGERKRYGDLFSKLPLAVVTGNGVLAVHGGLPDLTTVDDIDHIAWGDENWMKMTWGDFVEEEGDFLGEWGGRPQFGRSYFQQRMGRYQMKLLIRSHQPNAREWMFNRSCLTIFTSYAYLPIRTVATVDLENDLVPSRDVRIEAL